MRSLFILLSLCIASLALAELPKADQKDATTQYRDGKADGDKKTAKPPIEVKLLNTGKSKEETAQESARVHSQEATENWTIGLTGALVFATLLQFGALVWQGWNLKRTVRSTERASMPYLFPRVNHFDLYPRRGVIVNAHRPNLQLAFRNIGKTPAIVRAIRAELLLINRDLLPPIPPAFRYSVEVGSDAVISEGASSARRTWEFDRDVSAQEILDLQAEVEAPQYSRFFLFGYVIYDDFFGYRHTRRFCLKLRQHGYQAMKGGSRYNGEKEEKAPSEDDPLSIRAEERE